MANEQKSSTTGDAPIVRRGTSLLSPFEDMERWFDDLLPRRWLHPFERLERSFFPERSMFPELRAPFEGRWPKVDMVDNEDAITVRAELPGVTKDDLDLSLADNVLTIKAKTRQEKEEKEDKNKYYRKEISYGEFQRTLILPCEVKSDEIKAAFKDGVLDLTLPKQAPSKRKTIKVQ